MKVATGLAQVHRLDLRSPVVTWGVFDGVHRGHRHVIQHVVRWARSVRSSSLVVTFQPHPVEVITGRSVRLLCSLDRRLRLMESLGVDNVLVVRFTPSFSRTSAEEFVRRIVMTKLHARRVVLGHDTMFGKERHGNIRVLRALALMWNLDVAVCRPILIRGRVVSSSSIRSLISDGDLEMARGLLGYPPTLSGRVKRGNGRGRRIGFPTANLSVQAGVVPPHGVYATRARIGSSTFRSVTNVGVRPTFTGRSKETVVEVHLLGYRGAALYGKIVDLEFLRKIRDEKKFPSVDKLRAQIMRDIAQI